MLVCTYTLYLKYWALQLFLSYHGWQSILVQTGIFLVTPFWKVLRTKQANNYLKSQRKQTLTKPRIYVLGFFLIIQRCKIDEVHGSIIGIWGFNLRHCLCLSKQNSRFFPVFVSLFFNRSPSKERNGSENWLHINLR